MKPVVLVLARPGQLSESSYKKAKIASLGETVEELSHIYTILKERRADLVLIAENFPGINPVTLRKIRMRAPEADIYGLFANNPENPGDSPFDGFINLDQGASSVSGKIKRILKQRELLARFGMVGHSEKMKIVAETIDRIAPTDISVLIIGPSGTGKELVARAVHNQSKRSDKRFVAINCGALAEGVLESELFGHEKGAFTGSVGKREGLFKQADGGTIFLDEIGETKPGMQVKLLRVLEDGYFYPVGGDKPLRSNVRVLAATNRDLVEAIGDDTFREDLYFRLGVIKIILPPLRDRRGDIIPLLYHFAEANGLAGFSERAVELLTRYEWPGNVRQLRNFVARMAALNAGEEVSVHEVEKFIAEQGMNRKSLPVVTGHTREEAGQELIYHALLQLGQEVKMLRDLITANLPKDNHNDFRERRTVVEEDDSDARPIREMEQELIEKALEQADGNRKEASRILGIGERTLYRKLKKYDLN